MSKRYKIPAKKSKRIFRKTASRVNPKNGITMSPVMRGGIRF